jgi:hypothetical protein
MAGTRAQSGDRYGSGTLHSRQFLRGRLPLLSPAFRRSHLTSTLGDNNKQIVTIIHRFSSNFKFWVPNLRVHKSRVPGRHVNKILYDGT